MTHSSFPFLKYKSRVVKKVYSIQRPILSIKNVVLRVVVALFSFPTYYYVLVFFLYSNTAIKQKKIYA